MKRSRGQSGDNSKFEFSPLVGIGQDMFAGLDFALQDLERERIGEQFLNRALQRSRSERRIVTLLEQSVATGRCEFQRDLSICKMFTQHAQLDIDDFGELFLAKALEDNDVVDAVQELGLEVRPQLFTDILSGHAD